MPTTHSAPGPAGRADASDGRRRELGAFYTPAHVAEHMVTMLRGLDEQSSLLEPSGGDGVFVRAVAGLVRADQVEVWDVDPEAEPVITALGASFTLCDSLLGAVGARGFSHVIGNPPYLNKQSAYVKEHRQELKRAYATVGASETYSMFTYMALERLREGGQLVFLISDTFLTLGSHQRFREYLLRTARLDSVTLLPRGVFGDASVATAIVNATRGPAPAGHRVRFEDLRSSAPGVYDGGQTEMVPQAELEQNVDRLFVHRPAHREALRLVRDLPAMVGVLDGGLGMYTRDNRQYLGAVDRGDGVPRGAAFTGLQVVPAHEVDGTTWRSYHKRGGHSRWWMPAEHCVRWDEPARTSYAIPASALVGLDKSGRAREGFVVSGVASRLTARVMTTGAMWESNKAFGLFPKNPEQYPVPFFVAVLNSTWYEQVAAALNHTVSFQMRDVRNLPLLPHTPAEVSELAALGQEAVDAVAEGDQPPATSLARIDELVTAAVARASTGR